ncbi:hypothetical protein V5O48_017046 [Marasmius crinis-equi]|uniref:Uncharacterized protein n=1 Tax=Marasmius crinis-equi TaxID=585013 RepID=A0ABR3EQ15_9AGAR
MATSSVKPQVTWGRRRFSTGTSRIGHSYGSSGYESPGILRPHTGWPTTGTAGETTEETVFSFTLAMVGNPEVVQKAQDELDRVIDCDRLPSFDDEHLPNVAICIKETVRRGQLHLELWVLHMDEKRSPSPLVLNRTVRQMAVSGKCWYCKRGCKDGGGPERARDNCIIGWGR